VFTNTTNQTGALFGRSLTLAFGAVFAASIVSTGLATSVIKLGTENRVSQHPALGAETPRLCVTSDDHTGTLAEAELPAPGSDRTTARQAVRPVATVPDRTASARGKAQLALETVHADLRSARSQAECSVGSVAISNVGHVIVCSTA
jgi:uncharacterized iron-regulated membrane protein